MVPKERKVDVISSASDSRIVKNCITFYNIYLEGAGKKTFGLDLVFEGQFSFGIECRR